MDRFRLCLAISPLLAKSGRSRHGKQIKREKEEKDNESGGDVQLRPKDHTFEAD